MSNFVTSPDGKAFIKSHEGCRLDFYADSKYGYPTVGYGHLITTSRTYPVNSKLTAAQCKELTDSLHLGYTSPISMAKAEELFATDLKVKAEDYVNALNLPYLQQFSINQFDALVSLTFNSGLAVLATNDVQAMLAYEPIYTTYSGNPTAAELDICSRLVSKAFSYDTTLQSRRNEEAALFCRGMAYTHKYPVYTV